MLRRLGRLMRSIIRAGTLRGLRDISLGPTAPGPGGRKHHCIVTEPQTQSSDITRKTAECTVTETVCAITDPPAFSISQLVSYRLQCDTYWYARIVPNVARIAFS